MRLLIAGGVGEHGRNCFFVRGEAISFLVDCGDMAGPVGNVRPDLRGEEIAGLDAVFLTHSHADHTASLPWLYENGFRGAVIATEQTLRQLPFPVENGFALEKLCPDGKGKFLDLALSWGRGGHCAGSVWYRFEEKGKSIFFSGDYTENTQVYACTPIRGQHADLAVIDCAYGKDETSYARACARLVSETEKLLSLHERLLFPVPKYGRGLEIVSLLADRLGDVGYYADDLFLRNLSEQRAGGYWYLPKPSDISVKPYEGQGRGIVFVSDPQLRSFAGREVSLRIVNGGGKAVITGTVENGSFADRLFQQGQAVFLRYPIHLNYSQFLRLRGENDFTAAIPYHSEEFSADREYLF